MRHLTADPPIILPAARSFCGLALWRVRLHERDDLGLQGPAGLASRQQIGNKARVFGDLFPEARRLHARRLKVCEDAGSELAGFLFHGMDVMKFPNFAQAKSFGNFRLGKQTVSDYPNRMQRHPVSQLIANNLERLLKERGISALELANRANAGRSMVYDILAGRSASPKVSTVADLAAALNVPVSDLFLTPDQLQAQSELLQAYNLLPEAEQRRLAQVVRVWHLD